MFGSSRADFHAIFGYELIFTACLIFALAVPMTNINAIAKRF